jgi:hypothetical protein
VVGGGRVDQHLGDIVGVVPVMTRRTGGNFFQCSFAMAITPVTFRRHSGTIAKRANPESGNRSGARMLDSGFGPSGRPE